MKTNYDAQDGCVIRKQKNSHWIPQLPFPAFACSAVSRKPYRSPYPNPIVHHVSLALPAGTAPHFASMTPLLLSAMIYLLECLQNCPNFLKKTVGQSTLVAGEIATMNSPQVQFCKQEENNKFVQIVVAGEKV
jgi:hypothetical protein